VKNNHDPENVMFNIAGKEHKKFIYNDVVFLLVMIIADDALFKYETLNNLYVMALIAGRLVTAVT
jgi:hypothetical protein